MSVEILENLLKFLDINYGDNKTKMIAKIHNTRVEISGQKPTKLKKS